MNINKELKLLFIHVPKCAGKSIEKGFNIPADPDLKRSIVEGRMTELTFNRYGWDLNDYIKFCIVRNPWDRLVSLYHFRKREKDLYNLFPGNYVFGGDETLRDGTTLNFKEWIMNPHSKGASFPHLEMVMHPKTPLKEQELFGPKYQRKDHFYRMTKEQNNDLYLFENKYLWLTHFLDWIQQIHFITKEDGSLIVDDVLRFETLESDLDTFCDKHDLPKVQLPHINKNPRKKKNYVDYYDDELLSYIEDYMQDDIEHLGYKFGD